MVNANPQRAGPAARPIAEMLVDTPFNVPKIFKLDAELVNNMVEHGKAKMHNHPLKSISAIMIACFMDCVGIKEVNGVSR